MLGDDGKFLEGGDDDCPARFERLPELARGVFDVLHHAERLLELDDGGLELAVEHAPVGHHDDRVEDAAVLVVVQHRELVGEPGDGEALAAPGGVLDQGAPAGARRRGVADQPAHAVELLVAREDQEAPAGLPAAVVLLLDLVDELADEVEHAVPRPDAFPQVAGRVAEPGGRDRRVPGAAVAALVERQEAGLRPGERRGHEHLVGIHGEVGEAAAVGEQRLPRVAVGAVLVDRVPHVLAGERVLQFGGEDGDAVQEEREVEAPAGLLAEAQLADDGEEVRGVEALRLLVESARGAEVREPEPAAHVPDAAPEHVERPAPGDLAREAAEEAGPDVFAVVLPEPLPFLRLGGEEEVEDIGRDQAEGAVVVFGVPFVVAAGGGVVVGRREGFGDALAVVRPGVGAVLEQGVLDGFLERAFGDAESHAASARMSILPVTAAEMRAVRYSWRRVMAWWTLAMSASVLDVSWSRKFAMSRCSESVGTAVSMGWMSFLSHARYS